jgi:hypothetical protein
MFPHTHEVIARKPIRVVSMLSEPLPALCTHGPSSEAVFVRNSTACTGTYVPVPASTSTAVLATSYYTSSTLVRHCPPH